MLIFHVRVITNRIVPNTDKIPKKNDFKSSLFSILPKNINIQL